MKYKLVILFVLFIGIHTVCAYKILMVSLLQSKSHNNLCTAVVDTLAKKGHEVTFITPFPRNDPPCNEIGVAEFVEFKEKHPSLGIALTKMSMIQLNKMTIDWQPTMAKLFHENEGVKRLLSDTSKKFDLLIVEYFGFEFLFGLSVKYDCPLITLMPIGMINALSKMVGNPYSLATNPHPFLEFSNKMSLLERTRNFVMNSIEEFMNVFLVNPMQEELYIKYFPNESDKVSYKELKNRVSLVLMNTHPSIGVSRPLLPNVIQIGGYHINDPEPLPEDLQKAMDTAKNGVIYFSLGTVLQGMEIDPNLKQTISKTFSKLKQTVLWKFEEDIPHAKKVIVKKWMPQSSILAHNNLRIFITHGGLLSTTEATHYGVPLIVIPCFGDQHHNARMIYERGQGLVLALDNITESSLEWTIKELLRNNKFSKSALQIQKNFHDTPMKPKDLMVFYVEHVIRTNGAKHLSPPKLNRFSMLLLDVFAIILVFVLIVFYLVLVCCRIIFCKQTKAGKDKRN